MGVQTRCVAIRKRRRGSTSDLADISATTSQTYVQRSWHVWKVESRYDFARDRRTIKVYRDGVEVISAVDNYPLGPGAFGFGTDWNDGLRVDWMQVTAYKPSGETVCASSKLPVSQDLVVHASPADELVVNSHLFDQSAIRRNINVFSGPTIERNSWRSSIDSLFFDDVNDYAEVMQHPMVSPGWSGLTAYVVVQPADGRSACYLCAGYVSDTRVGWGIRSFEG